jgi:hypothetical protein
MATPLRPKGDMAEITPKHGVVCKNTVVGDWRRPPFLSDDPAWRKQLTRFAVLSPNSGGFNISCD